MHLLMQFDTRFFFPNISRKKELKDVSENKIKIASFSSCDFIPLDPFHVVRERLGMWLAI